MEAKYKKGDIVKIWIPDISRENGSKLKAEGEIIEVYKIGLPDPNDAVSMIIFKEREMKNPFDYKKYIVYKVFCYELEDTVFVLENEIPEWCNT